MPEQPSSHEIADVAALESDAQLTAFVLGELPEAERIVWEQKVADSAELQAEVQAIRDAASLVFAALQSEPVPKLSDQQRERILDLARTRVRRTDIKVRPVADSSRSSPVIDSGWALLATIGVLTACLLLIVSAATMPRGASLTDNREVADLVTESRERPLEALTESSIERLVSESEFAPLQTPDGDVVIGRLFFFRPIEVALTDELAVATNPTDADADGVTELMLNFSLSDLPTQYSALPEMYFQEVQQLDRLSRVEAIPERIVATSLDRRFDGERLGIVLSTNGRGVEWYENDYGTMLGAELERLDVLSNGLPSGGPTVTYTSPYFESGPESRRGMQFGIPHGDAGVAQPPITTWGRPPLSGDGQPSDTNYLFEGASTQTVQPYDAGHSFTFDLFDGIEAVRELNEWSYDINQHGQPLSVPDVDHYYGIRHRFLDLEQGGQGQAGGIGGGGVAGDALTELTEAEMSAQLGLLPSARYLSDDVQFFSGLPEIQLRTRAAHEEYRTLQRGRGGMPSIEAVDPHALGWRSVDLMWDDGTWGLDYDTNTESYAPIVENAFKSPMEEPLATLGVDVDTASYSNVRRYIEGGEWPPADAVRIEELLNSFTYDYPQPAGNEPFSVTMEVAACPWEPNHRLMRIGLQARDIDLDARPATSLVFLIDVSGSMSDADKLPLVQESLKLLLEQMTENDRLSIVTYRDNAQVALQSITGDRRDEAIPVIDALHAEGSTNGEGGLELAYEVATTNFIRGGQNRVILCTDGDFNVGESSDEAMIQLIEQKRDTGVFLSIFGFGEGNLQDSKLEGIADHGNGQYAYIDGIRQARRKLLDELTGTLYTVAKDVKLQVEFNPLLVRGYRLIGYENRVLAAEDFNNDRIDAGDIGAGHTVTALFEIIPGSALGEVQPSVDPLRYQRIEDVPTETADPPADEAADENRSIPRFYRLAALEPESAARMLSEVFAGTDVKVAAADPTSLQIDATVESHEQVVELLRQAGETPQVSVAWQIDRQEQVVVPAEVQHELCVVKVRYKQPDQNESVRLEFPVDDREQPLTAPSRDFHWASAVAGYGMLVRNSPHRGDISWNAVIEIAQGAVGDDADGRRAEFVTLARQTRDLWYRQHGIDNTPQPVSLDSTTARERAMCGGKYSNLLDKLEVPDDFATYGNFRDYGWWDGTEYQGRTGLPHAYWVYVYPHWYLWGEMHEDVTAAPTTEPLDESAVVEINAGTEVAAVAIDRTDVYFAERDVTVEVIQSMAGGHYGTVTLAGAQFDGAIIEGLRHTGSIQSLRLFGDGLSGQIPRLAHITGLTGLELGTPLRLLDLEAIGELSNLTHLKLPQDLAITVTGAQNIAKLTGLTSLDLYNCQLDDASLAELTSLANLEELNLTYTQVSDAGLSALSEMPHLKSLWLDRNWMTQTRITDTSAGVLASLTNLQQLSIGGTDITNDGLAQIASLPNLKSLSIRQTDITGEGLAVLASTLIESMTVSPAQVGEVLPGDPALQQLTQPMLLEIYQREMHQVVPAAEAPGDEGSQPPSDQSGSQSGPDETGNSPSGDSQASCDDAGNSSDGGQPPDEVSQQGDAGSSQISLAHVEAGLTAQMPGLMHLKRMPRLTTVMVIGPVQSEASLMLWTAMAPHIQWSFIDP